MKKLTRIFIFGALLWSGYTAASDRGPGEDAGGGLLLTAEVKPAYVDFIVVNQTRETVELAYPFAFSIGSSDGGLELTFKRKDVKRDEVSHLCAMVDSVPERTPVVRSLLPGALIGHRVASEDIRKLHCLDPGTYEMTARYHNVISAKELGKEPAPVVVTITFRKAGAK